MIEEKNLSENQIEKYILIMKDYQNKLRRLFIFAQNQKFKKCWASQWYKIAVRIVRT